MTVLASINLKGGVGKTSTCLHVSGELSRMGLKVLCVDNDPQSSLTSGFLGPEATRALDPAETLAAVYAGTDPLPGQVIRPAGFPGIDLLAGSRFAAEYNVPAPHRADPAQQVALREFLDQVRGAYHVVIVDNPPTLSLASWAALAAADAYIVPVQPEDFGSQGVADVAESVTAVRALLNADLRLAGYLITMMQARRSVHQVYAETLRRTHGASVFEASVPQSADYVEAVMARKPVGFYKPRGAAAKAVRAVAEELMTRLAAPSAGTEEAA
jgi:chromosome partitioning protein